MFASGTYGMPHGYPPFAPYTTTPLNSPPLGQWDFQHTPAPTPQPQSSPYSTGSRASQRRRRSEQISTGTPSYPSTPQPNRNSATPGVYPPYYNTPSPRPPYNGGVPSPKPGQGDFYYPMGPGGPMPPATPAFSPQVHPAEFEYDHPIPPPRERTRSRNSHSRTPFDMPKSPGFPEDGRKSFSPSREEQILAENDIQSAFARKNWDRQERPIALLGSVFDANSLGKWIYDWTVFSHSGQSSVTEKAGEMWLLLIQLSGKMKRAMECLQTGRVSRKENIKQLKDFLDSGERLWERIKRLLRMCENYMWDSALREKGIDPKSHAEGDARRSPAIKMGKNSGKEFVNAMFGKDRELERTEKLMMGMNLWQTRFEANCEEILKNPYA